MTFKIKKRIWICILILAAAIVLKVFLPAPGICVGEWISGLKDPGTARAIEVFYERLSEGDSFSRAAEVFHEEFP